MTAPGPDSLLEVRDLRVRFTVPGGTLSAVNGVDLVVRSGESVGVVGESGSGKSATCLAILGLHPKGTRVDGSVLFQGRDLVQLDDRAMRSVRGKQIGLVYQDPMAALNPVRSIGAQLREPLVLHMGMNRKQADDRAAELLARVGIYNARRQLRAYPHEFSGGMRQRIVIAMAVACQPPLLLADEPTTALDVSVQAQVLDLLAELTRDLGIALVLISHDLSVVASIADRVAVMYAGRVVEQSAAIPLFDAPRHPYTSMLLDSISEVENLARDEDLPTIPGAPPDLRRLPPGCPFAPRCPRVEERCLAENPPLAADRPARQVACWHPVSPETAVDLKGVR
ncbi:MAG: peptide/nickel transport system ATP-binding protein [Blastococcus sp.]|jgi:oligopeptide/dipeptide ABC transporter ATP-binding protein|nr:peptide/nickel transport system ATP-binding protein [Blastococcus sp.]